MTYYRKDGRFFILWIAIMLILISSIEIFKSGTIYLPIIMIATGLFIIFFELYIWKTGKYIN